MNQVFKLAGAAAYLGVTQRWLMKRVNAGELKCSKIPGPGGHTAMLRFKQEWLNAFLESHATEEVPCSPSSKTSRSTSTRPQQV